MGSPALLAQQSANILSAANNAAKLNYRRCEGYGLLADGSTPTATSGWVSTLSVASPASIMICPSGTVYEAAVQLTGAVGAGGAFTNSGTSAAQAYGHMVFDCSSGSAVLTVVWTDQHATAATKLTTAEIGTSLGTSEFVRIGDYLVAQTGASATTTTVDNEERSGFGDIAKGFNGGLAESEDAMNDAGDSTSLHG